MPNAWLNHVRQFRKQNRHLSYKQLLKQAKNTYGGVVISPTGQTQRRGGGTRGVETGMETAMKMLGQRRGGSFANIESRSSLTRMATRVGGRSRKTRRRRR